MLELKHIDKRFNVGTVNESMLFSDFNLTVETGAFVSVIGSNGSGKTTMLNVISGSILPDCGSVILDGKDISAVPEYKRSIRIGRVYQNPAVGTVPSMTVLENLSIAGGKGTRYGFAPVLNRQKTTEYRDMVSRLGLGLEDKMEVPVGLLSGGQRQALSLLMSTMTPIDLLLLDEHTAALDPKTAETIMVLTDQIVHEKKITTLMVTHNLRHATEYGNRLLMMHEGKAILDLDGEEKENCDVDKLLNLFNHISIEKGNDV